MIKSPKLELDGSIYSYDGIFDWELCKFELHNYFQFPQQSKHIQLYAYRESAADRVPVNFYFFTFNQCRTNTMCSHLEMNDGVKIYLPFVTRRGVEELFNGQAGLWHVNLYYWY